MNYLPISLLNQTHFLPLLDEEEEAWLSDLGWDYSPIRQILVSFIRQKLLPGYGAVNENGLMGYTYFLVNQSKGIIGSIYAAQASPSQEIIENLLSLTLAALKDNPQIKRVEAQIMPFNGVHFTPIFNRHGYSYYTRYYLDLDLNNYRSAECVPEEKLVSWDSAYLRLAAEMTALSYHDQTDAILCEDYRTAAGCESYLRSLIENPGCGYFMPEASFMYLDDQQNPCGFVIGCRISDGVGMIPQIAVHPSFQGHGLGNVLIQHSLDQYKSLGFHSVALTVTKKNRRAYDWYQHLGFKLRKEFGAYVWER